MKQGIIDEILELSEEQKALNIEKALENGVIMPIKGDIVIGSDVVIEQGAIVFPDCVLTGHTYIKSGAVIGPSTWLFDMEVGERTHLNNVQGVCSKVGKNCDIGPYVQIRPNCVLCDNVHLGNFVEVKNSNIDCGTKVSHLTYVGDSDVGSECNFGCGTVTVNYDGKNKHRTKIGNNCFIGCNTNLIAPVEVGDFAFTAAGSTITGNVPENSLAIARSRQTNIESWVLEKKPYKKNPDD